MPWWKTLLGGSKEPALPDAIFRIDFDMPGWTEQQPDGNMRFWRAPHGAILSLTLFNSDFWSAASDDELRQFARRHAASEQGGLIEVNQLPCENETALRFIYKRLQMSAYVFTGMFRIRLHGTPMVWTIVDGETGTTGVREAIIMAELIKSTNPQTEEDLMKLWGKDPYDITSLGVDSRVRRFTSDGEEYDERFPDHPLTRVRRFLVELRTWLESEPDRSTKLATVN